MLRLGLAVALPVVILDQLSKQAVMGLLAAPPHVIEVTRFFNLVAVWNTGVSFGLFSGRAQPWLLSGLALAVVAALVFWLRRAENRVLATGIALVIGGAIGNVIDRTLYGAVFDFLDLHAWGFHWPAFNLADSAIAVGVAMILADGLFAPQKKPM